MTGFAILATVLVALLGGEVNMGFTPSLESAAGYDSNIFLKKGPDPGVFNSTTSHFGFDMMYRNRVGALATYEIQYINYSDGLFSSVDNFVETGAMYYPLDNMTLTLLGQWENYEPLTQRNDAFGKVSAIPAVEVSFRRIYFQCVGAYSRSNFPNRPAVDAPTLPREDQVDSEIVLHALAGYVYHSDGSVSLAVSRGTITSNHLEQYPLEQGFRRTMDSISDAVILNVWQGFRRRWKLNGRLEASRRHYTDSPLNPPSSLTAREDMEYKGSLIVTYKIMDTLHIYGGANSIKHTSNNTSEIFNRYLIYSGIKIIIHSGRSERRAVWNNE